jgi:hypothetical protein
VFRNTTSCSRLKVHLGRLPGLISPTVRILITTAARSSYTAKYTETKERNSHSSNVLTINNASLWQPETCVVISELPSHAYKTCLCGYMFLPYTDICGTKLLKANTNPTNKQRPIYNECLIIKIITRQPGQPSRYSDRLRDSRPRGWNSDPGRGKIFLSPRRPVQF